MILSSRDSRSEHLLGTLQLLLNEGHAITETVPIEFEQVGHGKWIVSKHRVFYFVDANKHTCGLPNDHLPTRQ